MKKKEKKTAKKIIISLIAIPLIIICLAAATGAILLFTGEEELREDKLVIEKINLQITDKDNKAIELPSEYDNYADESEIPEKLKNAFVALEDKRFYSHHGLDFLRIGKAALNNLRSGSLKEGASTISQQLIKNTHLSSEKSFRRKLSEARLALKLEREYTKDEILTMYLNMLYFGSGEYGVKNAAKRFFGKELSLLNNAECAMLAGIVKSPTKYNPINNFEESNKRKDLVLGVMYKEGVIDEKEYKAALKYDIIIKNEVNKNNMAIYLLKYCIDECEKILSIDKGALLSGNFRVRTYLDMSAQETLEKAMTSSALTHKNVGGNIPDCAAIVIDNLSRGVKAFYSNCAYTSEIKRQPGSLLKPLVAFAPAIENGLLSPASIISDAPRSFTGYAPKNYKDEYYGDISVREALKLSLNIPAVEAMTLVGVENACSYLSRLGMPLTESDLNLSTALGGLTYGVHLRDLAGAYCALANGGTYADVAFIKEIRDKNGKILYSHKPALRRVFGEDTSYLITDMLKDTALDGTAKKISVLGYEIASKTGTVASADPQFNTDAYNASYTSAETAIFWQGNLSGRADDLLPRNITGGGSPTLFAVNYFRHSPKPRPFIMPKSVVELNIDKFDLDVGNVTLADENAPYFAVRKELFSRRFMPRDRNLSYTRLPMPKYSCNISGDNIETTVTPDPRLRYEIVRHDYFNGDQVVADFVGSKGTFSFIERLPEREFFSPRYSLKVYYIDVTGKERSRIYPFDLFTR